MSKDYPKERYSDYRELDLVQYAEHVRGRRRNTTSHVLVLMDGKVNSTPAQDQSAESASAFILRTSLRFGSICTKLRKYVSKEEPES